MLPVGGIRREILAAHRAGIRRVILPDRNRKDMVDIPESVRKDLESVFVKRIQEALELTLESVPGCRHHQNHFHRHRPRKQRAGNQAGRTFRGRFCRRRLASVKRP